MRHFIDLLDWQSDELREMLALAVHLKDEWRGGGNQPILKGKMLGLIFQKPSLRTRVSFEAAMQHLGGMSITLGPDEIGLGKRESIADVSRVISRYVQIVMARVFDHAHVVELAQYSAVPVINGLSDAQHPCQALADIMTIYERFGKTDGLRLAFVGDGNNVAASLLQAAANFGMHFAIASPPGYELGEATLAGVEDIMRRNGGSVETFHNPRPAVSDADVIYTDTWVSMGQEADTQARLAAFADYQVNEALIAKANSHAIVMHCLPAHRGQEITDAVADGAHSAIFDQAENRLHAQKAILVTLLK